MWLLLIVSGGLLVLMMRASLIEYKYYQTIKQQAPELWQYIGAPKSFKIPFAIMKLEKTGALDRIDNHEINVLAKQHRRASMACMALLAAILVFAIVFFKLA